jgi:hypothetical protein
MKRLMISAPDATVCFTGPDDQSAMVALVHRELADDLLRILICTDAAREGINLSRCAATISSTPICPELARELEQCKWTHRPVSFNCRLRCSAGHFVYKQREEDVVLQALVRKTEVSASKIALLGPVISFRVNERLEREGIWRPKAFSLR